MFKFFVQHRLEGYVKRYFKHHPEVKLIAVVGAAGKTTTKMAIAEVLSRKFKVQIEPRNYNEQTAVPLGILGVEYPAPEDLRKLSVWREVFRACREQIKNSDAQIVIQELGTDHVGEIPHFAKYLSPDITVITSIVPEHMEFFGTLAAVADEEFAMNPVSQMVLANVDDIAEEFLAKLDPAKTGLYGLNPSADVHFDVKVGNPLDGYSGQFVFKNSKVEAKIGLVGEHNLRAAVAAGAVGELLGLAPTEIVAGLSEIRPVKGRMNILKGIHNSIIIDDTYNSSPSAAVAALKTLYEIPAEQRIAVLGNMNELGDYAEQGHKAVGEILDGEYLEWVVTLGDLANKYIAPLARAAGLDVKETQTPIEAGAFVNKVNDPERRTVILFKGSQNGVFLEEAVKVIAEESEYPKLVRQEKDWIAKKQYLYEQDLTAAAETDDD
ncbi:MAG: UDP-N-acetylmuramoyl-tripeptide--D-alanyl-D-alanine ligase [Candidatus Nomurabacteria bacterium]|jgi:UDP-N-acetylmuramoyl-tripeptide--D-alanyl-D-alanine ligase|nr:UDP-N-acetylmuramoyl-tripeptide--D-alanyl-D-alanine ligase [Candidatus Nomurabacteria bacterium]